MNLAPIWQEYNRGDLTMIAVVAYIQYYLGWSEDYILQRYDRYTARKLRRDIYGTL